MSGLAKKLFIEQSKSDFKSKSLVEILIEKKFINEADLFFAQKVKPDANDQECAFLCYLFACFRQGHQCVKIDSLSLSPSWEEFDNFLIKTSQLIDLNEKTNRYIVCFKNYWYFSVNWQLETALIDNLKRIVNNSPSFQISQKEIKIKLEEMIASNKLQKEQAEAILNASLHSFSLIFGGPGTGKSYTAAHLLKLIFENLKQPEDFEIVVAAPTGKATAHLRAQILKNFPELLKHSLFKACTLHSLLEKSKLKEIDFLSADLFLIDESSMIDLKLISLLFQYVKNGARLILIGDPEQISPIGTGNVFKELQKSTLLSTVHLEKGMRSESNFLNECAEAVKKGDQKVFFDLLLQKNEVLKYENFSNNQAHFVQKKLIHQIVSRLPLIETMSAKAIVSYFKSFCVLSSVRKGFLGVDTLNQKIYEEHKKIATSIIVPVIITSNNAQLELYNGDLGLLDEEKQECYFVDPIGNLRVLSKYLIPAFELGYVLSIHKSQGSEYDSVMIILPEESTSFNKEILYTAITRARKSIEFYAHEETLRDIVRKSSVKVSALLPRLEHVLSFDL